MKMKLEDGLLCIADMDNTQYTVIKSWNLMKYNRGMKWMEGPATLELLDRLSSICRLPENIEAQRQKLKAKQARIDEERLKEHPEPLYPYPVKIPLFEHQIRGANMALITFGISGTNKGGDENGKTNQ